jgi:4a-hydroxytetrahydrobiopterin dehydratase
MKFANEIGNMAEQETHHPVLKVSWGQAQVTWFSFSIKGIHANDFVCAKKTDEIFEHMKSKY